MLTKTGIEGIIIETRKEEKANMRKESTFTGSNWGIIWRSIAMVFGMYLTLFIGTPWLIAWFSKWHYENTIIDEKQLEFTGEGKDLLFIFIYFLLTIVTFGLAALFMQAWYQRKMMAFVHFKES